MLATLLLAWRTAPACDLYLSAALTLALKVVFLPWLLHRLIRRLQVYWDTESLLNIPGTMLVGVLIVVFAFGLAQPISALASTATRNSIGIAVAVVLLSFLTMITRRKAMSQVVGFLSMENGLFFGAMSATYGMPMIVELGVALDVLVAVLVLGVFFFQIREQFDSLDLHHLESLKEGPTWHDGAAALGRRASMPLQFVLLLASSVARRPGTRCTSGARRWAPELNVAVSLATFSPPASLTARVSVRATCWSGARAVLRRSLQCLPGGAHRLRRTHDRAVLATLHAIEISTAASVPRRLRLYHSMYQLFMATMLLALLTNNMGLLWVAMEAATLSTVLLVTLYRTAAEPRSRVEVLHPVRRRHRAGAVRHDPAVLRRREDPGRPGRERAAVDAPERRQGPARTDACSASPSSSCWSATAPRSGSRRCTTGCRTRMPKARRRSPRCSPGCC